MSFKPGEDLGGLVGATVIEDQVQHQEWRRLTVDLAQEVEKLLRSVKIRHPTDDVAARDVEGGVETRSAMALVVVRAALDLAWAKRQHRLGPIERLNLRLLV